MSTSATPAFFVPGAQQALEAETRYEELRAASQARVGACPGERRIFSVACRIDGRDRVIEVGAPSPHDGREVLAIFEFGSPRSYSVTTGAARPELQLGRHVYSVTEFG